MVDFFLCFDWDRWVSPTGRPLGALVMWGRVVDNFAGSSHARPPAFCDTPPRTGSFSLRFSSILHQICIMKTKSGRTGPVKATPFGDEFRTSKKDKRQIKHATLMSKIAKSSKTPKKRRPSKKLVANLESLADALPEAADNSHDAASQVNIIKQRTLRHKPGALKRREKLEKVERDRFAKNMAQMASMQPAAGAASEATPEAHSTANRWSALRNFISQTMEQQPVFKTNQ